MHIFQRNEIVLILWENLVVQGLYRPGTIELGEVGDYFKKKSPTPLIGPVPHPLTWPIQAL